MNEDKFRELVNLYLDKEISAEDFKLLEAEIAQRSDRKRAFAERCRLHKAMRIALEPHNSSSKGQFMAPGRIGLPRWVLASGMAAAVVIGFTLLPPVYKSITDSAVLPELAGVTQQELSGQGPHTSLDKSDLRRFAAFQEQSEFNRRSSLIAQMRLMGLRPEYTPADKELKEVELAAVYKPKREVRQAELFQRIQGLKAMPEPKLLHIEETDKSMRAWPANVGSDSSFAEPKNSSEAMRF